MTSRNRQGRTGDRAKKINSQPVQFAQTGRSSSKKAASTSYPAPSFSGPASQYSRNSPQYSKKNKRGGNGKKIAIAVVCVLVLVLVGCGTAFAFFVNDVNKQLVGDKTEEEIKVIEQTLVPVKSYTDPFYMLLVGSDARDDDAEMGQRSDTNILVRVDPVKGIVTMISIPRDTKIDIDGYGTNKFNAAYNYGGISSTIREANQLCGIEISHYAEVDFDKMIQLVDIVGGVEINVPERIDDPDAGSIVIEAGPQTLNGEAALVFARSRDYVDGDFTRTKNQRMIIEALVKKILQMPVTDLPGIIQKAATCVHTDMNIDDLVGLATQLKKLDKVTIYSAMLPSSTADIGGISYVIADTAALKQMMALVGAGDDPSPVVASGSGYYDSGTGSSQSYDSNSYGSGTNNTYSYDPPVVNQEPDEEEYYDQDYYEEEEAA